MDRDDTPAPPPAAVPPPPPPPRQRRGPSRLVTWGLASGIALAVLVVAGYTWLSSEHALRTLLDAVVERSGGRLALDDVRGTLTGELIVGRVRWRDAGTEVTVEDARVRFAPASLLHATLAIREARAKRVTVVLAPDDGTPLVLPDSIGLPLAIDVDRLAVDVVEYRRGDAAHTVTDVGLAYSGDARRHRIDRLSLKAEGAALAGSGTIGARKPFDLDLAATLDLAAPRPAGRVQASAKGSLDALQVTGTSTLAGVNAEADVALRPLDAQPIVAGRVHAREVDLAALQASLPMTRLDIVVEAKPSPGGFSGTLEARNVAAGPIDRNRVPLTAAAASFVLRDRVLELSRLDVQVPGGGRAQGGGTIALDGWRNSWRLAITSLDLAQLHTSLRSTRLAGRVEADVDGGTQRVVADVAQDDLRLAFTARHDGRTVVAERFAAEARGGTLSGSGRLVLEGSMPFLLEARAERFDPSRFGDFPAGAIDGTLRAEGTAGGAPAAKADVAIAPGSKLAGLALAGNVRGRFTAQSAEGLEAKLTLGATRLAANGAINRGTQPLTVDIASTRLEELAPLLPAGVPALAGVLDARLRLDPAPQGSKLTFDTRGERLRVGPDWSFATLRAKGSVRHEAPLRTLRLDALAGIEVDASATGIAAPPGRLDRAHVTLAGALAAHTLAFEAVQGKQALTARVEGALRDAVQAPRWQGRVLALAAEGVPGYARVALEAPATLEIGRNEVVLGSTRIAGSGTRVEVDALAWRDGKLETRGRFGGLAVAPLARAAGVDMRFPMDVVLGGRWDIASLPQWQGKLVLERERGDVYVEEPGNDGATRLALGLETLRVDATIDGPRMVARGELRARLAGNTLFDATLEAPSGLHPFDRTARLAGTLRAHMPSLATLQPWMGTTARIGGQAIAELNLGGTLGAPAFTGQLVGYALRVDMPQYGINLADGRLRMVSSAEGVRLEEFEFTGGTGRLSASGTIGLPRAGGGDGSATRIAWRAEDFRALNHPDRRLVIDGEGTLVREQDRWRLAGRVSADEGIIAYRSTTDTQLADDIVVVGRERPQREASVTAGGALPLDIDLAIELGDNFRFSAEGLDTRLAGKLALVSRRGEPLTGRGTIRTVQGTYYAFGQRLTIDRGRLLFDGPVANPALDIVALRKNQAVEAGVEIRGTVRAPVVRLTSNPPVPDSEKLSWLLTGGPPGSGTQREMLALQAAQAALAGRDGRSLNQQFARNLGVDDIGLLNRGNATGEDPLAGQVISVGKRITERLYVSFEQGLQLATNALRIEYVLSRFFTLSAFAGTESGVELRFRRNWR